MQPERDTEVLAARITKSASKQTYYTIRLLVDRHRVADAYRAYGYFRWLDDVLDEQEGCRSEKMACIQRQRSILDACYRGETPADLVAEEKILADLVRHDVEPDSGLQVYLREMMAVMEFDADRRGLSITQAQLSGYTRGLAVAVTEAIYYFIGHSDASPRGEARYLAVTAAHIVHMLRDAVEDARVGYYNIPGEYLIRRRLSPLDVSGEAYREWACGRVQQARGYFKLAREHAARERNWRRRLAGVAYTARFEWMLSAIERDHYCLRCEYPERKSLQAGLWMACSALKALLTVHTMRLAPSEMAARPARVERR